MDTAPLINSLAESQPQLQHTDRLLPKVAPALALATSALLITALYVPWFTLIVLPGSPFESLTVCSVYKSTVCTLGSCKDIAAWDDAEPVLQKGQLMAAVFLVTSVVSSLFTLLRVAVWAFRDAAATAAVTTPSAGTTARGYFVARIIFRSIWSSIAAVVAFATFVAQTTAWKSDYVISKLPANTPVNFHVGFWPRLRYCCRNTRRSHCRACYYRPQALERGSSLTSNEVERNVSAAAA